MLANVVDDRAWMETMLHELGHGIYDLGFDSSLPWLVRDTHLVTTEATAILFGGLAGDRDWLERVLELEPGDAAALEGSLRAARVADLLVFTRWVLVMNGFERMLYANPEADLDALWWELVAKHQLLTPPEGRSSPDWAAKIHIAIAPVYYHTYLYGSIVASQLRDALAAEAGGLVDRPAGGSSSRSGSSRPGSRSAGTSSSRGRPAGLSPSSRSRAKVARRDATSPPRHRAHRRGRGAEDQLPRAVLRPRLRVRVHAGDVARSFEDTSPAGFARAALVLAMVWWAWSAYAWMTNAIDIENSGDASARASPRWRPASSWRSPSRRRSGQAAWFAVAYFVVRILNRRCTRGASAATAGQLRAIPRLAPWFLAAACRRAGRRLRRRRLPRWVWPARWSSTSSER